jgi:MerR family redox-sensitive transcriptional activator SoxR
MTELTIGEVAQQAGIRPSALRYYESIGLLPPPRRINGRRRYDPSVVQTLALLQLAKQAGFSMAEIQTLFYGFEPDTPPAHRWQTLAHDKMRELDALIERAQRMKRLLETGLACGCLRLEECVIVMSEGCAEHPVTHPPLPMLEEQADTYSTNNSGRCDGDCQEL